MKSEGEKVRGEKIKGERFRGQKDRGDKVRRPSQRGVRKSRGEGDKVKGVTKSKEGQSRKVRKSKRWESPRGESKI